MTSWKYIAIIKLYINNKEGDNIETYRGIVGNKLLIFEKLQERKNYYIIYTCCFAIMMFLISLPLIVNGKSFVWTLDALPLHTTNTIYLREYIKNIIVYPFGQIDFTIGMGTDPLLWLSTWYTEPINIISIFFDIKDIEFVYNILIVLRFYLIGLSFSTLARQHQLSNYQTLFGALIYTFCGYSLFAGFRHPIFLVALIFLPLLLAAEERVINQKSPIPFVILVFIALMSNYYFMYINTLLMIAYLLIRYISSRNNQDKSFKLIKTGLKLGGFYLIGLFMSAFILFPAILNVLNSARIGKEISVLSYLFYDTKYYRKLLSVFINPALSAGYWIRINLAAISFISVVFLFVKKNNSSFLRNTFIVLIIFLLVPLFAFIFSGFSSVTNRWCYSFAFFIAFLCAFQIKDILSLAKRELMIITIASCLYIPLFITKKYALIGTLYLFLFLAIIILKYFSKISLRVAKYLTLLVLCTNIFINSVILFGRNAHNYSSEFMDSGVLYKTIYSNETDKSTKKLSPSNEEFYRFDYQPARYESGNRAIPEHYYGLSSTYSVYTKNFINFSLLLDNAGLEATNFFEGFDNRMTLNALASVKYLIGKGDSDIVPFGYEIAQKDEYSTIYRNKYAQSIGLLYTRYMLEEDFKKLSLLDRQEALLNSVILPNDIDYLEKVTQSSAEYMTISAESMQDEIIIEKGESVRLYFNGVPNKENYLRIRNISENPSGHLPVYPIIQTSNKTATDFCIMAKKDTYTLNRTEYTVCLGYSEVGISYCDIVLPQNAYINQIKIHPADIDLLCMSTESYMNAMEGFNKNAIKDIKVTPNKVTFTARCKSSSIMNLSIPYSKGWSVKLDGKETEVLKTNIMYMGLELKEGTHDIELTYKTPGLTIGYIVSAIGFILFLIISVYLARKSKINF